MLYCQATAGLMITELRKLSSENLFIKAGKCLTFYYSSITESSFFSLSLSFSYSDCCEQLGLWLVQPAPV